MTRSLPNSENEGPTGTMANANQSHEHRDRRRRHIDKRFDLAWVDLLFQKKLQSVGQRLQQTVRADAIRPVSGLHPAQNLALSKRQITERCKEERDRNHAFDE